MIFLTNLISIVVFYFYKQHMYMNQQLDINSIIEPSNLNWWTIMWKIFLWLCVWLMMSFIIFMITILLGRDVFLTNPLLPLILMVVAFVTTFVGNMIIASLYSLFMGRSYYDLSKTLIILLRTNVVLFLWLAPLYIVLHQPSNTTQILYMLAFHILFSIFISYIIIETVKNPNYTGSAFVWWIWWLCLCLSLYGIISSVLSNGSNTINHLVLLLLPSICGYTIMPLCGALRDIIYYRIYQFGSNPLYISSISEVVTNDASGQPPITNEDIPVSM